MPLVVYLPDASSGNFERDEEADRFWDDLEQTWAPPGRNRFQQLYEPVWDADNIQVRRQVASYSRHGFMEGHIITACSPAGELWLRLHAPESARILEDS